MLCQLVEIGRLDRAAVAAELPEPGVVEHDEEDVRCAFWCPRRSQPGWLRLVRRPPDYTRKLVTLLILDDWHLDGSHLAKVSASMPRSTPR